MKRMILGVAMTAATLFAGEAVNDLKEVELKELGSLRCRNSREIADSPVSIGFECLDRELFDPEKCYEPLAQSGVKWARCQTGWSRCETEKGVYDFRWLDRVVDRLRSDGIQPWFNVGFGNKLYMQNIYSEAAVGCVPLYYGEEAWRAWCNYIRALSRHFAGRVQYFEIWNESNISNFWQPRKADPLEYAKLVSATGKIIREEVKNAKIGACVSGSYSPFVAEFLSSGVAKELDFFSIHPYCIQPELEFRNHVQAIRRTLKRAGAEQLEIWQGESGFASWFPEKHWLSPAVFSSERNQAVWQLRRYVTDMACGLKLSSFFQMADMMGKDYKVGNETRKNPARHGILNGLTYTPKQSYFTLQRLATIFSGGTRPAQMFTQTTLRAMPRGKRESRLIDLGVTVNTFERNGYPVVSYHLAEDMQFGFPGMGNFELTLHAPELKAIQKPVLLDPLSGKIYDVKTFWKNDEERWFCFQKLPLTDFPLLLTDRSVFEIVSL